MARMIPSVIYPECPSPGEREVFRRLKEDPGTEGWTVLHSLNIPQHDARVEGEADFVIVVPSRGVLCAEVKGCSSLKRSGGLWYYGSDPEPDPRGPFKQAAEAMHSIRRRLMARRPDLRGVVFWSGVILPYVTFAERSPEWHDWQCLDSRSFRSRSLAHAVAGMLDRARAHLAGRTSASWFHPDAVEPYPQQCDAIVGELRSDFDICESPELQAQRLDAELRRFTEEQLGALDAMETNPRVVFAGPAGTGKTVLAIEATRRAHGDGARVLFVCFNRLLGRWLAKQTSSLGDAVVCRTMHAHALEVAGCQAPGGQTEEQRTFWVHDLPLRACERLMASSGEAGLFDALVVDEAQDILRDEYLDFLDLSIKGGLSAGRWRFFGDFEDQAVYSSAPLAVGDVLEYRGINAPTYSLRINCRNTPRIASLAHILAGLDPDYSRVLRPDDGVEPEVHFYESGQHQTSLLIEMLKRLHSEGITGSDIVILSPKRFPASVASSIEPSASVGVLAPIDQADAGSTRCSTIHAFKGLEAPAVVVTDVSNPTDAGVRALLYVALTRALRRLAILIDASSRSILARALRGEVSTLGRTGRG